MYVTPVCVFVESPGFGQAGDTRLLLAEFHALSSTAPRTSLFDPRLAFLKASLDLSRVAVSGHSAGAEALQRLGDVAQVLIPMAGSGAFEGPLLRTTLVLGGANDSVDGRGDWGSNNARKGYGKATTPAPKRLAGVDLLGHHFCSDLCWIGADQGGIVAIAVRHGILIAEGFKFLANDGCQVPSSYSSNGSLTALYFGFPPVPVPMGRGPGRGLALRELRELGGAGGGVPVRRRDAGQT
jgi:hypothetical protein